MRGCAFLRTTAPPADWAHDKGRNDLCRMLKAPLCDWPAVGVEGWDEDYPLMFQSVCPFGCVCSLVCFILIVCLPWLAPMSFDSFFVRASVFLVVFRLTFNLPAKRPWERRCLSFRFAFFLSSLFLYLSLSSFPWQFFLSPNFPVSATSIPLQFCASLRDRLPILA